jgi:hypothetical protein
LEFGRIGRIVGAEVPRGRSGVKEKIRSGFLFLAIIAGCFVISVPYRYLHEERAIDDCLSGKHGSFDYSTMSCDLNENHAYVPYRIRHAHDQSIALVAVLAFALFLSGYRFMGVNSENV